MLVRIRIFHITKMAEGSLISDISEVTSVVYGNEENAGLYGQYDQETKANKERICNICGRVLSSNSSYYVHMKSHSTHKPYKCAECEASFCRKPYLKAHIRTHTGERPFQCKVCEKQFTQKSSLNIHSRIHTGERPYECDICFKRFAVKSYVTSHRMSHISEDPVPCAKCGLQYQSREAYNLHLETHREKSYHCLPCRKSFKKANNLLKHNLNVHRGHVTT